MITFELAMSRSANFTSSSPWGPYATSGCGGFIWHARGASLLVVMLLLIILTILGLTALQVATTEERMSGNSRDRGLAFQAAEAALRDAEFDIRCQKYDGTAATTTRGFGCISGMTGADASCTDGLCCNNNGLTCVEPATPVYQNTSLSLVTTPSVEYGSYTNAPALAGVTQQPRYLIEPFVVDGKNHYRITARGYGVNANTQVTLQEIYKE